jgi:hypothetical protein
VASVDVTAGGETARNLDLANWNSISEPRPHQKPIHLHRSRKLSKLHTGGNSQNFMTEHELIVAEYARSLSKNDLIITLIDQVNRAVAINNSGAFKVASVLITELESRGLTFPELSEFRKLIDEGVRAIEEKMRCGTNSFH